jgi:hypothetical protein
MKKYPEDYLKYWRVIRQYMKAKHGLSQADLDVLLFLYSEPYFDKSKFIEFNNLLSWDRHRFDNLLRDGWIENFRKFHGSQRGIYNLSDKAKNVVRDIYKKLNGEEIPTSLGSNPMFYKNVKYSDKVYRNMILEMNESIKQQRRQSRE